MSDPDQYFVDYVGGSNSDNGLTDSNAWATVYYALTQIDHDAGNGVQINIKESGSGGITTNETAPIDIPGTYSGGGPHQSSTIGPGAPLIFRGYQEAPDDWYPGKAGHMARLRGYNSTAMMDTEFPIFADNWDMGTSTGVDQNYVIVADLRLDMVQSSSTQPHVLSANNWLFINCIFTGGAANNCVQLGHGSTFINCYFHDMGNGGSSSRGAVSTSDGDNTFINCTFQFLTGNAPFFCVRTNGETKQHFFNNVFLCGPNVRAVGNNGSVASDEGAGTMFFINNTMFSNATSLINPIGGTNQAKKVVWLNNLSEGWNRGFSPSVNWNVIWGANSAYNNNTDFYTTPDIWYELDDNDSNSGNKSLATSPFQNAINSNDADIYPNPALESGTTQEGVVGVALPPTQRLRKTDDVADGTGTSGTLGRLFGTRGAIGMGPISRPIDGGPIR